MFPNCKIRKYVKLSKIRLITLTLVDLGSSFKHKYTQWRWTFLVLKKQPNRDWFDENDASITELLNEKNRLHEMLLSTDGPGRIAAEQAFKEVKSRLQCEIRHMKNRWSCEISAEIQKAYDCKDSKSLYSTIRKVFGPQPSTMVPLKSKDGSVLIKYPVGIMARWTELFTDLFDNPSATDESVINGLLTEMMTDPTFDEMKYTIKEVNTGKAPGLDGIPVELLHCGRGNVAAVYTFILGVWHGSSGLGRRSYAVSLKARVPSHTVVTTEA